MSITLLRTLTYKSKLKFGTFRDCTIDTMFKRGRHDYIAWVYYNMSMISFTDDILKRLKIKKNELIDKPGINKSLGFEVKKRFNTKAMEDIKKKRLLVSTLKPVSKGAMARKNQGHL